MEEFKIQTEQFADIKILRYRVPGFENLPLKKKVLLYYLYEAALSGRDIIYDQNYKYNLLIRHTLENILKTYTGDKDDENWQKFLVYIKKVWFSNGIHHHYSMDKFAPEISEDYFRDLILKSEASDFIDVSHNIERFIDEITPLIFDKTRAPKRVVQDDGVDMIEASANNFYEGITQKEAEEFYQKFHKPEDQEPPSYGLNSKLVKIDGEIVEQVWKIGGMYSEAIEKIVFWLQKALEYADSEPQKNALAKLVEFYRTGDLKTFDEYSILWLQDQESEIDVVNGFIEVYGDALGRKATFESVVSLRDDEATRRAATISQNAQWFEDHSPTQSKYKKEKVRGVSARGINVVVESGDCSPSTPIGINLPNADWIRAKHGSKSVTINNIMVAYDEASKESGVIEEFAWSDEEIRLSKTWGVLAGNLHVDLHEIVGHGSGKLGPGVGNPGDTLKNYASTIEEARADIFALYFATDQKLIELGLMPSLEVGYAEYNSYLRGGMMTQLVRVELGKDIEESHMRNRQLIVKWAYEKGRDDNVIEKKIRDGKTFFVVNDHAKLREIFGELLCEIQRIKSEGDFNAAKMLVENYGVKVDQEIHKEVLERWKKLNIAPFAGFINPKLKPVLKGDAIEDVIISYPDNFMYQMLEYGEEYSFLPKESL
ncbi:MAG: dipeptidyl peptidase 3 [Bacteroidales bacterium]|nr:dipeptidyl peptidase 3 [Bacteroidales bacterium]